MAHLSPNTVITAIIAVDRRYQQLQVEVEAAADPELADVEEEMMTVSNARAELKSFYAELARGADNLPAYEQLTSR